jgi:hypothetical protein
MEIPIWADEQLSNDLPILRFQGESQYLEFKKEERAWHRRKLIKMCIKKQVPAIGPDWS